MTDPPRTSTSTSTSSSPIGARPEVAAPGAGPVVVDAHGRVAGSLSCRSCGYDLRGVDVEGPCPECGAPVADALDPTRLLLADPRWLRRTAIATAWIAAAGPAVLVADLLVLFAIEAAELPLPLAATLFTFVHALATWGGLVHATREPRGADDPRGPDRAAPRRRAIALGFFGPAAGTIVVVLVDAFGWSGAERTLVVAISLLFLSFFVALASSMLRTRRLLGREGRSRLGRLLAVAAALAVLAPIGVLLWIQVMSAAYWTGRLPDWLGIVVTVLASLGFLGTPLAVGLAGVVTGLAARRLRRHAAAAAEIARTCGGPA